MREYKRFMLLAVFVPIILVGCRANYHTNPDISMNVTTDDTDTSNQTVGEIPYERFEGCLYIWEDKENKELLQGHVKLSENVESESHYYDGTDIKILVKKASYPEVVGDTNNKLKKAVEEDNKKRKEAFEAQVKEGVQSANSYFQGISKESNKINPFEFNLSWQVIRNDENLLTIVNSIDTYAGGAHPNLVKEVISYNPVDGKRLTIASLTDNEKAFSQFVEDALNTYVVENNCGTYLFPENTYKEVFKNWDKNWWIINGQLFVGFNTYDIAPYVAGPLVIPVDITKSRGLLNDYGKKLFQ